MCKIIAQDKPIDTILKVKKQNFLIEIKRLDNSSGILSIKKNLKTILSEKIDIEGVRDIEFIDFNHDGNLDFVITFFSNNEFEYLYLFDPRKNDFKRIVDFYNSLSSVQLKSNASFFYSYERAGCADYNWESNLFQIIDFKLVNLGHIDGKGCEFEIEKNPQVINIFKVLGNNTKFVETLPYKKYIPKFEDKWIFIEKYWNKNYTHFK